MALKDISNAVSSDSLNIPLISFDGFVSGNEETRQAVAQAVLAGFQNAGFIYLKDHGIPKSMVDKSFTESKKFFDRPSSQKEALAWTSPEANRGYSAPGQEKVNDSTSKDDVLKEREAAGEDLKESFEIGLEPADYPNNWPDRFDAEGTKFKEHMLDFFGQLKQLHLQVMSAIAVGMGLDANWFERFCDAGDNTLRLLHYPEVEAEVFRLNKNQVRAGAHSDYGSITLLFQDSRGGLQVCSPNGNFVDATPIEDTIVVNAADLLARWANDTIKSTKHRVVEPPTAAAVHPARYSIAYFCNPNFDAFIDAIPGTYDDRRPKKYQGINSGEYLVERLSATY